MSRGEYFAMRMFSEQFSFDAWEYREFFTRAGLSEDRFEQLVAMFASFRTQTRVARALREHFPSASTGGRYAAARGIRRSMLRSIAASSASC